METWEDDAKLQKGIIINNFPGATIHNLVINGNMVKQGPDQYNSNDEGSKRVNAEQLFTALKQCKAFIWAHAAYSIPFCVCRDVYHLENNASNFERMLAEGGIVIPAGTINTAMSRSPWMKFHVDKWEEKGVRERVLKLRDEFRQQMEAEKTET